MKRKLIPLALWIVLIASLAFAGAVFAHALLLRSVPDSDAKLSEPPHSIELWFSEPIEDGFSSVRLIASSGDEIPLGAQTVDAADPTHLSAAVGNLEPGIYTVAWDSLSRADGHAWAGNFPFTVLNPDGSLPPGAAAALEANQRSELPTPLQSLARWLGLIGAILLVGIALFLGYVAAEMTRADAELDTRLNDLGVRVLFVAVAAILLGGWFQVASQIEQIENLALLPRLVYDTYGGALNLARQAFSLGGLLIVLWRSPRPLQAGERRIWIGAALYLVALIGLLAAAGLQEAGPVAVITLLALVGLTALASRSSSHGHARWNLLLLTGCAILLGFSAGSHAGAAPGSVWAVAFDLIHMLAASAWVGGLMLLPLVIAQRRQTAAGADVASLRPLFRRYGYMAKLSFFLLWATGLLNSLVHIPSLDSLLNTAYGQVLLLKLLLMLVVWWISSRSSRVFRGKPDPARMADLLKQFSRQVATAALIGLALLLSVAVLSQTQPPEIPVEPGSTDYHEIILVDDLNVHLQVSPAQIGMNQFYLQLYHDDRSDIGDVQLVRLTFENLDEQLGQSKVEMNIFGLERYWAEGAFLNRPGHWKVSAYVRRRGMDDLVADLGPIELPPPSQRTTPFQNPVPTVPASGLLAGALIVFGAEIFRWRKTLQQAQPTRSRLILLAGGILIALGVALSVYVLVYRG